MNRFGLLLILCRSAVIMQQIGVQHLSVRTTLPLHTQKANMVSICAGQNHKAMLLQS